MPPQAQPLSLVSEISDIAPDALTALASALNTQFTRDVLPRWGASAVVSVAPTLEAVPKGSWPVVIETDIDEPGAAGVHENEADGTPIALISGDGDWRLTTSHEAIETIIDPSGDRMHPAVIDGESVSVLEEPCDPCEAIGYTENGVNLSNFVYPSYYDPQGVAPFDHLGQITAPFELLQGGYLSYQRSDGTWLQKTWFDGPAVTTTVLGKLAKNGSSWRQIVDRATRLRKAGRSIEPLLCCDYTSLRWQVEELKAR